MKRVVAMILLFWLAGSLAGAVQAQGVFKVPVQIVVLDGLDKPVAGASVSLQSAPEAAGNIPARPVATDATGVASFEVQVAGPTAVKVRVSKPGYSDGNGTLDLGPADRGQSARLEIGLGKPNETILNVTVIDKGDQRLPNILVTATHVRLGDSLVGRPPEYSAVTGIDGVARLAVQTGRYPREQLFGTELRVEASDQKTGLADNRKRTTATTVTISYRLASKAVNLQLLGTSEASDPSHGMAVEVLVQEAEEPFRPVENASVTVEGEALSQKRDATTNALGLALLDITVTSARRFTVEASKNGYRSGKTTFGLDPAQRGRGVTEVGVRMARQAQTGPQARLQFEVRNLRDTLPVDSARVRLTPLTTGQPHLGGHTGVDGRLTVTSDAIGLYQLEVSQDNFVSHRSEIKLDRKDASFPVKLTESTKTKEDARVAVFVTAADKKDSRGRPAPIPGATVRWGNSSTGTDVDGKATVGFTGQLGVDLQVEAPGYKTGAVSVDGGRYFQTSEFTRRVQLEPAGASAESPFNLEIRIEDAATRTPVSKASVRLLLPDGRSLGDFDALNGSVTIGVREQAATLSRAGLFVEVSHAEGYADKRETIPVSMLQPSREPVVYLVQLDSLADGELGALEAEVQRLEGLRSQIQIQQVSAANQVTRAARSEDDAKASARAWQTKLNQLTTPSGALGVNLPAACNATLQDAQRLDNEADAREKKAIDLLARADSVVKSCTSAAQADAALATYTQGAAESGAMLAASQRARTRLPGILTALGEAETNLTDYAAHLKLAAEQADQAAVAAGQAMEEVRAKGVDLQRDQARARARLDAARAYKQLRPGRLATLRNLDGRLTVLVAGLPGPDHAAVARNIADNTARLRNHADKILSGYDKQACSSAKELYPKAVEKYESNHTAVTLALNNIRDLPQLADRCRQQAAANAPLPVPDLSGVPASDMAHTVTASRLAWAGTVETGPAPNAGLAGRYVGQQPRAGERVAPGSAVQVYLWGAYKAPEPPRPPDPPTDPAVSKPAPPDTVTVPNLARYTGRAAMESALYATGLTPAYSTPRTATPKGMEGRLSGQSPAPGSRVPRRTEVVFGVYPAAPEATGTPVPSAAFDPALAAGGVPGVIGDSLAVAQAKLEAAGLHVGGISRTVKAPTPERAGRIYAQSPGAGSPLPGNRAVALQQYDTYEAPVVPSAPGSPTLPGVPGALGVSGTPGSAGSPGSAKTGGLLDGVAPPVVTYEGSTEPLPRPTPSGHTVQPPVYRPPDAPTTVTLLPPPSPNAVAGTGQWPGVQGHRGPVWGAPLPLPRPPAAATPAPPPRVAATSPPPPPPAGGATGCSIPSIAGPWANANGFRYEVTQSGSNFSWRNTSRSDGVSDGGTGQFLNSTKVRGTFMVGTRQSSAEGNVYALDSQCRAKGIQWNNGLNIFRN